MANFSSLKQAIETYIKQNGNKEITGALLQSILLSMVTTIGDGAVNDLESDVSDINGDIADINGALTASVQFTGGSLVFKNANDTVLYSIAVSTFLDGIVARLNSGAVYAGYAVPSTTPNTLAGQKVFYVATQAGTYIHFLYNGDTPITLAKDGIYFIVSGAGADDWNAEPIQQLDDVPTPDSNNPIKSGAVLRSIIQDGSAFDLSAHNAVGGVLATYADLSEALTALNSLDAVYKQPGMSFKFVQSSDNKYVQCKLTKKEWSTDTDDWVIADEGTLIENPEFCRVYTDKNKRIIVGVRTNGDIFFGAGVPQQVIDYVTAKIAELSLDEYEKIVTFLGNLIDGDDTLAELLDKKVDTEEGKSLINEEFAENIPSLISPIDNPEYADIKTDNQGRIIEGIRKEGAKEINVPVIFNGAISEAVDDVEFIRVFLDSKKKIIFGIRKDGDVLYGYGVPKQIVDYVEGRIAEVNQEITTVANELSEANQDIDDIKDRVDFADEQKLMKITKNGTNIDIRTKLSTENDILIAMFQRGQNITFQSFYVGSSSLSDSQLKTNQYLVGNIYDIVGAIGIQTFWFLYAQHGWTIPKMTVNSQSLDNSDIGSVWADNSYNDRRFIIGKIDGNDIYLIPEITKDNETDIYSAAWNGSMAYPTTLTHVSGAVHTGNISGTSLRYDLNIQNVTKRAILVDSYEISDNGTYYCDEFSIKENILGYNIGKVETWFPESVYNGSLIDWDRTFIFKGSMCTCNTIINCQYPFKLTDYRGCIPMMPLQVGNYHSYSFIPKVKKQVNGHRVDLPFNSDDGTIGSDYVSVVRNTTDLYDVDIQPERCINYLKDNNDNYLVGMAGGCSLVRGITTPENRNTYNPLNTNTCTYGGDSTKNKFYPKPLQGSSFTNNIVDDTFIKEFSCYYCWFDPSANEGQVYWYKDGDSYILYCHCQTSQSKLAVNLPDFMEGMVVNSTIEKTDGATLLTTQVVSGRLYVSYDTTDNAANYIVLKLK